jgi:4-hydroxybenzoate polyprenyltransferase
LRILKKLLDFILFGNIYVAIGTVCLIQSSIIQLGYTYNLFFYSLLSFFATLFIYNFQRVFYVPKKDNSLHSVRRKWIFENPISIKTLTLIGFIGVCICFFFNNFKIILYLSPLLILSLAYFLPFIKLRKSAWFKLFTLTIVWTMVTAVVPILLTTAEIFTKNNMLHIAVRFCFMIAICIPFDIRDLTIDKADNVSTLPHLFGENKTRWIAFFFMIIYILLIIGEYYLEMFNLKFFCGLLISALINTVLVLMSSSKRSEYFFVAGIDGTMILQGILLIAANFI